MQNCKCNTFHLDFICPENGTTKVEEIMIEVGDSFTYNTNPYAGNK